MSKTLIAYYSRCGENYFGGDLKVINKGNTEIVAEKIAKLTGGDLFEIKQVNPYANDYNICINEAKDDKERKARPELENYLDSIKEYDTIYLGYPNYWGTCPMATFTFLDKYDFKGKTIKPFCTHEGSGLGNSEKDLKNYLKDSSVKKGLAIQGTYAKESDSEIESWIKQ